MKKVLSAGAASVIILLGAATGGSAAASTTINFDDLPDGTVVTTQYAGVTFSSDPGEVIETTAQSPPYLTSSPNFICSATTGAGIDCAHSVNVDFAGPVNGLSFYFTGADVPGTTFNVDVYENFALFGSATFTNNATRLDAQLADLTSFTNVTRISINNVVDPGGLGYDDFTFTAGGGGAVPEPTTWALMLIGFGLAGAGLRRRDRRAVAA